jgi:uncharacterized protein YgfB (UPF0149 family)
MAKNDSVKLDELKEKRDLAVEEHNRLEEQVKALKERTSYLRGAVMMLNELIQDIEPPEETPKPEVSTEAKTEALS